ncbi:MAG: LemA family protein [Proteobacteria bacterium]|nr:LemA family protein [Pseudomonadota bacterium]
MYILLGFVVIVIAYVPMASNGLVSQRQKVEESWSGIDVQMKRRYNLIPNLVETVKGYAGHERETLDSVTEARTRAMANNGLPGEQAKTEGILSGALKTLFAVAEAYPDLKANDNFMQLQGELSSIEDQIQMARRYYNGNVRDMNTRVQQFPSNLVAGQFGFSEAEFFELDAEAERVVPAVNFAS